MCGSGRRNYRFKLRRVRKLEICGGTMSPHRVLRTLRRAEYAELIALFFIQGAALGMWFVPLSGVLGGSGLDEIKPFAFTAYAIAAFISPLIFGAMADRDVSPVKVLRGLSFATAVAITMTSLAIQYHCNAWIVLVLIQIHALFSAPTFSISSTIIFARLANAQLEFGPIRAMATSGWMFGALLVSLLNADASARAGYICGVAWLAVCAFTWFLPKLETPTSAGHVSRHERLGLDALTLLKNRDHRVVFIIAALSNIPIAGFYPYAPPHLAALGFTHTSGWMSLAQTTEVISMFALGALLTNVRLKWIFTLGLIIGVLRFVLSALNTKATLLIGVTLHGASFALIYITAQIYVDQRIAAAWRARAQSLLTLMSSGVGNLFGYLGTAAWFARCAQPAGTRWPIFWAGLAGAMAVVLIYFLAAYRGNPRR
jgi:MFS family permease